MRFGILGSVRPGFAMASPPRRREPAREPRMLGALGDSCSVDSDCGGGYCVFGYCLDASLPSINLPKPYDPEHDSLSPAHQQQCASSGGQVQQDSTGSLSCLCPKGKQWAFDGDMYACTTSLNLDQQNTCTASGGTVMTGTAESSAGVYCSCPSGMWLNGSECVPYGPPKDPNSVNYSADPFATPAATKPPFNPDRCIASGGTPSSSMCLCPSPTGTATVSDDVCASPAAAAAPKKTSPWLIAGAVAAGAAVIAGGVYAVKKGIL